MGLADDAAELLRENAVAQEASASRAAERSTTWGGDWTHELVTMLTERQIPQRPLYHYSKQLESDANEKIPDASRYQTYQLFQCTLWRHGWVLMGWKLGSDLEHVKVKAVLESNGDIWDLGSVGIPLEVQFDSRDLDGNPGVQGSTYRAYRGLSPEHERTHLFTGWPQAIPAHRATDFREHLAVPVSAALTAGAEPRGGVLIGVSPSVGTPPKRL